MMGRRLHDARPSGGPATNLRDWLFGPEIRDYEERPRGVSDQAFEMVAGGAQK